jgi:hypothetical protein
MVYLDYTHKSRALNRGILCYWKKDIEPKQCMNNQESKFPLRNYELDWTQTVHEQPGEQVSSQKLRTLIDLVVHALFGFNQVCSFWEETCSPGCSCTVWVQSKFIWTTRRASLLSETMNFDWTQTVHEQPGEQVSSQKLRTWLNPNSAWDKEFVFYYSTFTTDLQHSRNKRLTWAWIVHLVVHALFGFNQSS